MIGGEKDLWIELYDLEREGVFGDEIISVTYYVPNAPKRRGRYTKIVCQECGVVVHRHVRRVDEKWVWGQWGRTVRYRAVRRRLMRMSRAGE